jgi:hypothetical protein
MDYRFNKGSEWRKWDLHIHTKGTNKNDQFNSLTAEIFFELFFRKAISNKISGIGITDYFSIDNYIAARHYIEKIGGIKDIDGNSVFNAEEIFNIKSIFIFPNVELRMLPCTGVERLINIHCLFNPNYIGELENNFFGSLENQDGFKMNRKGIVSYGKSLNPNIKDENQQFKEGLNKFAIDPKSLKHLFDKNKELRENTLIVVSNSNKDGNSGLQKHYDLFEGEKGSLDGVRTSIYKLADAIFSTNEKDVKYFLGNRLNDNPNSTENDKKSEKLLVIKERGSLKPCIVGSDAHREDELFNRFTWIKADPTFEGLKQILCEPEGRVKIQGSSPEDKKLYNVIEKVRFVDNSGQKKFSNYDIGFNSGLNAIIGGKSSGKSLLMHLIAKSLGNGRDTKEYTDVANKVDLEVFYADEPEVKRTSNDRRIIEFLPQLYIEKIVQGKSESQNSNDHFNTFISDLIKQDDDIKALFDEHNAFIEERTKQISESITNWVKLDRALIQAKKELLPLGDKSAINNEILKIEGQVKELTKNSGLTTAQIEQYQSLTKETSVLQKDMELLDTDETETNRLINYLNNSLEAIIDKAIYFDTKSTSIMALFSEIKESLKAALLAEASKSIFDLDLKIGEYSILKQQKQSRLTEIQTLLGPILEKNKIQTQIKAFEGNIVLEKKKVAIIEEKESEVLSIKGARDRNTFVNYYSEIIGSYNNLKNKINEKISSKWDKEQTKLTLIASSIFNNENFVESISSIINVKSFLQNQFEDCGFSASTYKFEESSHISNISKILVKCISDKDRFNNFKNGRTTEELLRALFKDCNYLDFDIKKGEDSIRSMSEGKKGIVILQLYLSLSKADYPILIDQPEDNLDNRTVYVELNDYIKKCKEKRQIIMVSHNANLVVNTDAENIIVANQMGEDEKDNREFRFEYINGALENTFEDDTAKGILYKKGIREHVCEILEGGTDAFKKREEKYHLSK